MASIAPITAPHAPATPAARPAVETIEEAACWLDAASGIVNLVTANHATLDNTGALSPAELNALFGVDYLVERANQALLAVATEMMHARRSAH